MARSLPRRQPALLDLDELVEEILLRLPPDEPAYLVNAALVCRSWRRVLSDPGFRRRYIEQHRSPPLLGYVHNLYYHDGTDLLIPCPRLVPTSTTSSPLSLSPPTTSRWWTLDCRHGRVLVLNYDEPKGLLVWDPITGEEQRLDPPNHAQHYNAAVLCAVDGCDHLDCRGGPFRVVLVGTDVVGAEHAPWASVFSSETGEWSDRTFTDVDTPSCLLIGDANCSTRLIGDALYFTFAIGLHILKYDMNQHALSVIDSPCVFGAVLKTAEDGRLGFISVLDESIYEWSSLRAASSESTAGWEEAQQWVMDLGTLLPSHPSRLSQVVGLVEGTETVFINSNVGLFTLNLKSRQVRKVGCGGVPYNAVVPYRSFYVPA